MWCQNNRTRKKSQGCWWSKVWTQLIGISIIITLGIVNETRAGFACSENPCFHGICIDYLDVNSTHQCYCRNGYTGYGCQINWNECNTSPCLNNGVCTDGIASFNCSCPDNFAGTLCQYDLSECEELHPCQNNGTCTIDTSSNSNDTFTCICPPGFMGPQCDLDVSICNTTENACLNGGKCIDGIGANFHCECKSGWYGTLCEIDIDECESQPCLNGGICVNKLDDFGCACPFGFAGKICEKKLKICEVNPCENGAFCLHEDQDETQFTCFCVPDYHGIFCEYRYNDCDPSPKCFNGGTCIDGVGDFFCSCPPDFFGTTCQCTTENMTDPSCHFNETVFPSDIPISPSISISISAIDETSKIVASSATPLMFPSLIFSPSLTDAFNSALISPSATPESDVTPTLIFVDSEINSISLTTPSIIPALTESIISTPTASYLSFEVELSSSSSLYPDSDSLYVSMSMEGSLFPSTTILGSLYSTLLLNASISEQEAIPSDFSVDVSMTNIMQSSKLDSSSIEATASSFEQLSTIDIFSSVFPTETIHIVESPIGVKTPTPQDNLASDFESQRPLTSSPISLYTSLSSPYYSDFSPKLESTESIEFSTIIDFQSQLHSDFFTPSTFISAEESLQFSKVPSDSLSLSDIIVTPTADIPFPSFSIISSQDSSIISTPTLPGESDGTIWSTAMIYESDSLLLSKHSSSDDIFLQPSILTTGIDTDSFFSGVIMTETVSISDTLVTMSEKPIEPSSMLFQSITPSSEILVTSTPSFELTTPESTVTLPSPSTPPLNNASSHDSCQGYCLNNGKCISDSIELYCKCPFKFGGSRCERRRKKFSSTSFTGDSFLGYNVPNDSINRITTNMKLATNAPDGILFYTSSSKGRLYALIFTQGGHITLHFSCGAQSMHFVETRTRVNNGYNFTLEFKMEMVVQGVSDVHCVGQVSVNQSYIMRGEQIVRHNELFENPIQFIYLGGVAELNARKNDDFIAILPGFRGCLYSLLINQEEKDLFEDAVDGNEVSECSAFGCVTDPCYGLSKCTSHNRFPFWQCTCPPGYQGIRCQIRVCDSNPCRNGATCTFPLEDATSDGSFNVTSSSPTLPSNLQKDPICLCSLGFFGNQCQSPINVSKPSFKPISDYDYSAFIAYAPIPRFSDWVQMKLHFVTRNVSQTSLLVYSGYTHSTIAISQPEQLEEIKDMVKDGPSTEEITAELSNDLQGQRISDFFAITYVQGYVVLTWNLGSGTQRIFTPSKIDRRLNVHTLFAGRSGRQAWLKVDGMRNITGKSPGPFHRLNVNTELFVGGFETFRFEGLPHDLPLHKGFDGCIFDFGFRVKNRLYLPKALRGRNVKNCYEEDC